MKAVGISGSPRKGGNTECLVRECLNGFAEQGWEVSEFYLSDKIIKPCIGCETCVESGVCVIKDDDMASLYEELASCDAFIIGAPVYYRNVTAQLKAVFDRSFAYRQNDPLMGKPGGAITVGRGEGGGQGIVLTVIYNYMLSCGALPVPGELNGLSARADKPGDILSQGRRLDQARVLAQNLIRYAEKLRGANTLISSNQETDKERRAGLYPIILSEYNPAWPEWFAEEKANLERMIGVENIVNINHYGSTSVPGLTAKPTVDILLEINENTDLNKLIANLPKPDYICLNEAELTIPTPPPHLMFLKGYLPDGFAEKVYHIHVVYPGDHDELRFRDYLIAHPEAAAEYASLKQGLFKNYRHDRDGYTGAKSGFVKRITKKAREESGV